MPDGHAGLPEPRRGRALAGGLRRALRPRRPRSGCDSEVERRASGRRRRVGGETADGERERFDVLVVASGHNEVAAWPSPPYPGATSSPASSCTRSTSARAGTSRAGDVMVVGMGNSAMDIATDLSHFAARTLLSVRRGSWVIPKRLLGKPADQVIRPWVAVHVPWRLRQPIAQTLLKLTVGRPEDVGLPGARGRAVPVAPDDLRHDRLAHRARRDHAEAGDRGARARRRAVHRRHARGRRRDRVVHGLPRDDPVPRPRARRRGPARRCASTSASCTSTAATCSSSGSCSRPARRSRSSSASRSCSPSTSTGRWAPPSPQRMRADAELRFRRARGALGRPRPADDARRLRRLHARARGRDRARARAGGAGRRVSRRAIVTGAGGAIGSALVDALRERGWEVVGLDLAAAPRRASSPATSPTTRRSPAAVPQAIERLGGARRARQQRRPRRPGERRAACPTSTS